MIRTHRFSMLLLLASLPASSQAFAARQIDPASTAAAQPGPAADPQDDPLYAQGTKAMDEQRWVDAVTAFDRVASAKGKRADAALYWKAYSLDKLGRKDEARTVCTALSQQQPKSTWNRECYALRMRSAVDVDAMRKMGEEMGQHYREMAENNALLFRYDYDFDSDGDHFHTGRTTTEDDIRLLALNSLMRTDPAKALPMLRDVLRSDKPIAVRKQALFVLSRSKQPEAQALLTETATNRNSPELQRAAIGIVAVGRGKDAGPMLVEVYRSASDAGVKRAAVNGLAAAHDAPRLVELARTEKDLNQKRDIVSQLALMHDQAATDYMLELLK